MTAHVYFGLGANVLTLVAVGYAVLYALGLARGPAAVRLLGLAYLVGWGVLGLVVSYLMMAGVGFDLKMVLVAASVLVVACVVAGQFVSPMPAPPTPAAGGPLGRLGFVIGAAVILFASVSALVVSVQSTWTPDSDTIALWVPHASVIWRHGLWFGSSGWTSLYHPEYPPLISTMYAFTFASVGDFHPSLLPFGQCLLGLSFIGALLALLDRCVPRGIAFTSVALLMVAPEFFTRLDSLLPDQPVAYFVASAAVACVLWLREGRIAWLALSVMLSAAGTLIKLEGATYALLLALIVLAGAAVLRRRRVALRGLALLLGLAAIEPWRLWLRQHGLPTSSTDYHVSSFFHPLYMAHRTGRVPYSVDYVLHVMLKPGNWLVILPLALFAILSAARRSPVLAAASGAWVVLAFAGLILVYWGGKFRPVHVAKRGSDLRASRLVDDRDRRSRDDPTPTRRGARAATPKTPLSSHPRTRLSTLGSVGKPHRRPVECLAPPNLGTSVGLRGPARGLLSLRRRRPGL